MNDIDELTEEQLNALPDEDLELLSGGGSLDQLSDEGLAVISGGPAQDISSIQDAAIRSGLNMATLGYLPEIQGAIASRSLFSGPEYEKQKKAAQLELRKAQVTSPGASAIGGGVGAIATGLIPMAGAKLAGRAGGVAANVIQGLATNPGDVENEALARLKQGAIGLGSSAVGELVSGAAPMVRGAAKTRGTMATRPFKADVRAMKESGRIQDVGGSLLDEKIIGLIPRSQEVLLKRTSKALDQAGKGKGELVKEFSGRAKDVFGKEKVIDLNKLRIDVYKALRQDTGLGSDAIKNNKKIMAELKTIERGKDSVSIERADDLKQKFGKKVNDFYGDLTKTKLEQKYNQELYHALNKSVDDAVAVIAKNVAPEKADEFEKIKKTYGSLKMAKEALSEREIADFTNRAISPSDYYAGGTAAQVGASLLDDAKKVGYLGLAAGALNNFMRRYGNQITSKQLDILSKALASPKLKALGVGALTSEVIDIPRSKRLKALEE